MRKEIPFIPARDDEIEVSFLTRRDLSEYFSKMTQLVWGWAFQ